MIHTFTIKTQISAKDYKQFIDNVVFTNRSKGQNWILENTDFDKYGLTLKCCKYILKGGYEYYCYEMKVNPSRVIGNNQITDLYYPEQYTEFERCFNEFMGLYPIQLPLLSAWKVYRIDYTIDIKTPYVEKYIRLFKKADFTKYKVTLDSNRNRSKKDGSVSCGNKSITLNFYNKQNQVEKQSWATSDLIEQAQNILRIEVQCKKQKIYGLKKSYELNSIKISEILKQKEIAYDVIGYYVEQFLGRSTYYKKNIAETMIKHSNHKQEVKEKMIEIIGKISAPYQSIDKARKEYSKDTWTAYKGYFNKLDINLVTLDKHDSIKSLPSIIDKLTLVE